MPGKSISRPSAPEICPVCGEDVPRKAVACPECGADHRSGWSQENTRYDGLDLPDSDMDYDEFMRREFGTPLPRPNGLHLVWWVAAIVLLVAFACAYFLY